MVNGNQISREDHLQYCKSQAAKLIEVGDIDQAICGMIDNLERHPETKNHESIRISMMVLMSGRI